jgi:hypothetical protein
MPREELIRLVRSVIQPVLELFSPQQVEEFDDDFAAWTLGVGTQGVAEKTLALTVPARGLDTTLVAGMFFQVLVEAEKLPKDTSARVSFVRKEAKNFLVKHLAGEITLSQFYRLLSLIEENVHNYFEYLGSEWLRAQARPAREALSQPQLLPKAVKEEELRRALSEMDLLPPKGRRITTEGLWTFLKDTQGRWFRLLDLEAHFRVNKKTAWTYLNMLLKAGILEHNGEKANRVRYTLAGPFQPAASSTPA